MTLRRRAHDASCTGLALYYDGTKGTRDYYLLETWKLNMFNTFADNFITKRGVDSVMGSRYPVNIPQANWIRVSYNLQTGSQLPKSVASQVNTKENKLFVLFTFATDF